MIIHLYNYTNNNECDFTLPSSGYSSISITVNATNVCGTSTNTSYYLSKKTYGCGSFLVATFPNPADNEMTIKTSVIGDDKGSPYEVIADEVVLIDNTNTKLNTKYPATAETKLDTRNVPAGVYFLRIKFGEESVVKQVIIKK